MFNSLPPARKFRHLRRQLLSVGLIAVLFAALLPTSRFVSIIPTAQALSTGVVISQVYGGGGNAGATYTHDFIELFNRGNTPVDISAWSVQYASAGGNSWNVTNLCSSTAAGTCVIDAGKYYLVQQAAGTGGTTGLPTPINATGNAAMSGTNGKVALANNRTALTVTCPTSNAAVVDFVGYGGTTTTTNFCFEGAGPAPAPSNTTADIRGANGCTETDNNNTDFTTGAPTPRNSASPANLCGGGDAAPTVSSTTPANSATNVAVDANITVNFSEPVNVSNSSFTISCSTSGTHTYALTGSSASYTLNPDTNFANSETCTVTVVAANVTDADSVDPPDTMASNYVFSFQTVVAAGACGDPFTPVFQIQGSGAASPMANSTVNTEAVVTADFQLANQQSGFYIQDPNGDANNATSDGIFVFQPSITTDVAVGDRVRVTGRVVEFNTMTEIDNIISIQVCTAANTLPAPVAYDLPEPVLNDLERVEGMRVTFPEPLYVTGNNLQGRFGEVMLSSEGRLFQQNSFDRPNSPGALARADLNRRRQIMLDDASSTQNPNPIPYIGADNTLRAGDTTTNLTGVIDYGLTTTNSTTRDYRVQPTATVTFARTNPRPVGTPAVAGTLRAASANVLNYFNGNGDGTGFPTERGANTAAEFARQRAKIISALTTLNPDVLGVIEMENDGGGAQSALQDLVNGMNEATAPGTYAGLHSPNPGTDAIQNAIIYKPSAVTPVGAQVNDVNPAWDQARAPLAQTFQQNSNNEKFTFIVNHFTSKGCSNADTGGDADQGDGQGCDNATRQQQAQRLLVFIQDRKTAAGDPDVLSMGDYNAYGEEDPMFIMEQDSSDTLADGAGGLISLTERFVAQSERYSYQFDATFGELDHALATKSMNTQVAGTLIWHINADEPTVIDYNTEFKTQDLYTPTPYRSADHDPLLVGLKLGPSALPGELIISEYRLRGPSNNVASPGDGEDPTFDVGLPGMGGIGTVGDEEQPLADLTPEANNEFIELYNNTNADITVNTTDGSAGWALVASDGVTRFIIPNNTIIPARSHYLATNTNGYTLDAYPAGNNGVSETTATGDITYTEDIPDLSGIALFNTANAANFTEARRLDAVGYSSAPALYREGGGFVADPAGAEVDGDIEYSFFRDMRGSGLPKDTGDNVADFRPASTGGETTTIGAARGAPGPENRTSPIVNPTRAIFIGLLDPSASPSLAPNRVRNTSSYSDTLSNTGTYPNGTMSIRRTITNGTTGNITRLRFRVIDITVLGSRLAGEADMRVLSAPVITATVNDGARCGSDPTSTSSTPPCDVTVQGTTLETPPDQPIGGGWNSSLSAGTITLQTPLAPGASVNVQFLMGVAAGGKFRFVINTEALP